VSRIAALLARIRRHREETGGSRDLVQERSRIRSWDEGRVRTTLATLRSTCLITGGSVPSDRVGTCSDALLQSEPQFRHRLLRRLMYSFTRSSKPSPHSLGALETFVADASAFATTHTVLRDWMSSESVRAYLRDLVTCSPTFDDIDTHLFLRYIVTKYGRRLRSTTHDDIAFDSLLLALSASFEGSTAWLKSTDASSSVALLALVYRLLRTYLGSLWTSDAMRSRAFASERQLRTWFVENHLRQHRIALHDSDLDDLDACLIKTQFGWSIHANSGLSSGRRDWVLCHELGHFLLHHRPGSEYGLDEERLTAAERERFDKQERDADAFAALCMHVIQGLLSYACAGEQCDATVTGARVRQAVEHPVERVQELEQPHVKAPLDDPNALKSLMAEEAHAAAKPETDMNLLAAASHDGLATMFNRPFNDSTDSLADALRWVQIYILDNPAASSFWNTALVVLHCHGNPVAASSDALIKRAVCGIPDLEALAPSIDVVIHRADSLIARACVELEQRPWALPDAGRQTLEEALAEYARILAVAPEHAIALRQSGVACYCLDEFERAESYLVEACRLNDTDPVAAAVIGLIYADRKDSRAAVNYLQRAFDLDPRLQLQHPRRRTYELRQLLERCRAELIVEVCTQALMNAEEESQLFTERGHAYWLISLCGREGQVNRDKALQDLERAVVLNPRNALALVRYNWIESGSRRKEAYARAVEMDPGCAEAHLRLAQSLGPAETDRAMSALQTTLLCDPSMAHVHCQLGQRHLDRGDLRQAQDAFEAEIAHDPNCFDAYLYLEQIYAALNRREDAGHALQDSLRTSPYMPYQGTPGVALADSVVNEIHDLARRMLSEKSHGSSMSLPQLNTLFQRANGLVNEGRTRAAVDVYSEILRQDPQEAQALAFRGGCYASLGEEDNALADLMRAIELDPRNVAAWLNLAGVHRTMMRFALAQQSFERARLLAPDAVPRQEE
jgi:tetratricopeptide (TPR) repeat protein